MPSQTRQDDDRHAASIAYQIEEEENSPLSDMINSLPGYVSRGLIYIVLSFAMVAVAWAAYNKVNVIVSVDAKVIPEGKLKVIQPLFTGTVQEIRVRQGDRVRAGDTLIVYQSKAVSDMLVDLKAKEAEMALAKRARDETLPKKISAIEAMTAKERQKFAHQTLIHEKNLLKRDEQLHRLSLEIKNAQGRLKLISREIEVSGQLAEKGFVSERKMLELQRAKEGIAIEIERLRSGVKEAKVGRQIDRDQFNLEERSLQSKVAGHEREIAELRYAAEERYRLAAIKFEQAQDVAQLNLVGVNRDVIDRTSQGHGTPTDVAVLTAPVDGVVAGLAVHNPGENVERGQTVLTLVPEGVSLITELTIPDRDIGKVKEGQPIKFKFSAFPFADHGVLTGAVQSISPSTVGNDETAGPFYRAESLLSQDYFKVKGQRAYLLPGMTATAEIRTERKSIMALLLAPFAQLREARQAQE